MRNGFLKLVPPLSEFLTLTLCKDQVEVHIVTRVFDNLFRSAFYYIENGVSELMIDCELTCRIDKWGRSIQPCYNQFGILFRIDSLVSDDTTHAATPCRAAISSDQERYPKAWAMARCTLAEVLAP